MFPQGIIDHVPQHREGRLPAQQEPYQPWNWTQHDTQSCAQKPHQIATSDSKLAWQLVCYRNKHALFLCSKVNKSASTLSLIICDWFASDLSKLIQLC